MERKLNRNATVEGEDIQTISRTTPYEIRGKRVCQHVFAAINQTRPRTLNNSVKKVLMHPEFVIHTNETKKTSTGRRAIQNGVSRAFLIRFGELNG